MKRIIYTLLFFIIVAGIMISFDSLGGKSAYAGNPVPLKGWAWADTVGWVSFGNGTLSSERNSNYGVSKLDDGTLSGYAWSDSVGWIRFDSALMKGPAGTDSGVKINNDNTVTGWARACGGTTSADCTGTTRSDGWDGWIKFTNANVTTIANSNPPAQKLTGFSWGSDVVGWVSLMPTLPGNTCNLGDPGCPGVCVGPCTSTPSTFVASCSLTGIVNNTATYSATNVSGGKSPYTYSWDGGKGTATAYSKSFLGNSFSPATNFLTVTDANSSTLNPSCPTATKQGNSSPDVSLYAGKTQQDAQAMTSHSASVIAGDNGWLRARVSNAKCTATAGEFINDTVAQNNYNGSNSNAFQTRIYDASDNGKTLKYTLQCQDSQGNPLPDVPEMSATIHVIKKPDFSEF